MLIRTTIVLMRRSRCAILRTLFFFFQAEDGIRDVAVTGVQTCALPIFVDADVPSDRDVAADHPDPTVLDRSEERREGKSVDLGGRRIIKKKKHSNQDSTGIV